MSTAYFYQNSSTKGQGWFICKASCIWLLFNSKNVKSRNYKATLFIWQGQVFLGNWIKPLINSILFIGSIFLSLLTSDMHLYSAPCTMSPVTGRGQTQGMYLLWSWWLCAHSVTSDTPINSRALHIWSMAWSPASTSHPAPAVEDLSRSYYPSDEMGWQIEPAFFHCKANPVNINHHQA